MTVRVEIDGRGVARLTLARPEKRNAMSAAMIDALGEAARRFASDPAVRVVVLCAEGATFCAGADLDWMREQMAASRERRVAEARRLADMLGALDALPKPLIARVQGDAFGGGVGLIAVADVTVAANGVRFGLTETRLGLIPATIAPYVVARMGAAKARRVVMSGRVFGADEAQRLDLIARVVPPGELDTAVEAEVAPCLAAAPGAVAAAKALLRRLGPPIDEAVIGETIEALVARWDTDEAAEGIAAFFEKRRPGWVE